MSFAVDGRPNKSGSILSKTGSKSADSQWDRPAISLRISVSQKCSRNVRAGTTEEYSQARPKTLRERIVLLGSRRQRTSRSFAFVFEINADGRQHNWGARIFFPARSENRIAK